MGQFKVGDKVRVVKEREDIWDAFKQLDAEGTIIGYSNSPDSDYKIQFNFDNNDSWYCLEDEIELIEEPQTGLSDTVRGFILTEPDKVNPPHYKKGSVECIDAIKAATVGKGGFEGYLVGNIIKYIFRYEDKGGVEDLKKAGWYLNKLIDEKST